MRKGNDKAVEIGARDVFEMAARVDARVNGLRHHLEIVVHGLCAGFLKLFENVVVRAAHQDAALLEPQVARQLKILLGRADPARDFGEAQAQLLTAPQRLLVLFAVKKELALANLSLGAAKLAHQLVEMHNLLGRVGRAALLPVAEGGVGNPNLLGRVYRGQPVVEGTLWNFRVRENLPVQMRLFDVLQVVVVLDFGQQVGILVVFNHCRIPPYRPAAASLNHCIQEYD